MKKKVMVIELNPGIVEGDKIERDISDIQGAPIGAHANDQFYAELCQRISAYGYTDTKSVSENNYTHIAPAQMRKVSVRFITE